MKVFVSYSSLDDEVVRSLAADLERARHEVWLDQDLSGGEAWWAEILKQIRECDIFVLALTNDSLRSVPCQAERDYARALGRPILPVQVGEVTSFRTDPIFSMQIVDYRDATKNNVIDLVAALHQRASEGTELPDDLPEPPPMPFEYLQRLGAAINSSAALSLDAQAAMLFELRTALEDVNDKSVVNDIYGLLHALRDRKDVVHRIVREIDSILERTAPPKPPDPPPPQPPVNPGPSTGTWGDEKAGPKPPPRKPLPEVSIPPPEKKTDSNWAGPVNKKPKIGVWLGVSALVVAVIIGIIVGVTARQSSDKSAGSNSSSASPTGLEPPTGYEHAQPTVLASSNAEINAAQVNDCVVADLQNSAPFLQRDTGCAPGVDPTFHRYYTVLRRTFDVNECATSDTAVQASDTKVILCLRQY